MKAFNLKSLPEISTKVVTCTVTSQKSVDTAIVYAYDYYGIERRSRKTRCYEVPLYRMTLSAEGLSKPYNFKVIRWGVVIGRRGDFLSATSASRHYGLIWQDKYMGGKGAWRLYEGSKALIHDGKNYPQKQAMGAAGCIEISGMVGSVDAWNEFNKRVRELSGIPPNWQRIKANKLIQKNKSLNCIIQHAAKPHLKSVSCP